jgi:uncharacterized alkaline shock family protein YloU
MKKAESPVAKKTPAGSFAVLADPDPENNSAHGDLLIHENAISSLIRQAVTGIPGVSHLTGSSFVDNIAEMVRSRKIQDRAISLRISGDSVSVEISIYTYFGFSIPEVAAAIRKAVTDTVFSLTGLRVSSVDVDVRGIDEVPPASAEDPEQA